MRLCLKKKPNDDGDDEDGYDDGDGGYDDGQDVFVCKNISFSMNLNIYEYFSMSILFRNSIILIWISYQPRRRNADKNDSKRCQNFEKKQISE